VAANTVGDTTVYQLPAIGYPDKTLFSDPTNPGVSIFTNTTGAGGTPIIFANAFAEGALGWAGMVGGVAIIPAAAMGAGAGLGMAAPAPLQQAAGLAAAEPVLPSYVYDNSPDNETAYDASFYFNPNGFITPDGPVDIFVGLDQNGVAIFGVQYEGEDEEQELRAWVLQDENMVFVGDVKVSNASHLIELAWLSGGKAKFSLFFDEQLVGTVTGNTSTHLLNQVMLGAVTGLTAESIGSLYFDEFTSSKIDGSASNKIFFPWLRK
jgi:hypothetical protein